MSQSRLEENVAEIVVVESKGVGSSIEDAEKDAIHSAVSSVVGKIVDAEVIVENDELIKDYVLTYSNGYVKSFRRISEPDLTDDGLYRVSIRAEVRKRKLAKKLETLNVCSLGVSGESLFSEMLSREKSFADAKVMLEKLFDGFPVNVLQSKIAMDSQGRPDLQMNPKTHEI